MNDSKLNDLFKDFRNKYPKMDYFTQEEIFQLARMAFHVGYDAKDNRPGNPVIRSDGKPYISIREAARKNTIDPSHISRAIKKGWKAGGYHWKYADKYHI